MRGSLDRRLTKVEEREGRRHPQLFGTLEDHYLRAWPPIDQALGDDLEQCQVHGPTCAVRKTPVAGRVRRLYILDVDFIPPRRG